MRSEKNSYFYLGGGYSLILNFQLSFLRFRVGVNVMYRLIRLFGFFLVCALFISRVEAVEFHGVDIYKDPPIKILPFVDEVINKAKEGDSDYQLKLSVLYSRGIGVDKDPAVSKKWLLRSGDAGNSEANFFIAQMYLFAAGEDRNIKESLARSEIAADAGHVKAAQIAGSILYGMYGKEFIDLREAESYLLKSFNGGDGFSSFLLACIYRYDFDEIVVSEVYLNEAIERRQPVAVEYSNHKEEKYLSEKCSSFRRL